MKERTDTLRATRAEFIRKLSSGFSQCSSLNVAIEKTKQVRLQKKILVEIRNLKRTKFDCKARRYRKLQENEENYKS